MSIITTTGIITTGKTSSVHLGDQARNPASVGPGLLGLCPVLGHKRGLRKLVTANSLLKAAQGPRMHLCQDSPPVSIRDLTSQSTSPLLQTGLTSAGWPVGKLEQLGHCLSRCHRHMAYKAVTTEGNGSAARSLSWLTFPRTQTCTKTAMFTFTTATPLATAAPQKFSHCCQRPLCPIAQALRWFGSAESHPPTWSPSSRTRTYQNGRGNPRIQVISQGQAPQKTTQVFTSPAKLCNTIRDPRRRSKMCTNILFNER